MVYIEIGEIDSDRTGNYDEAERLYSEISSVARVVEVVEDGSDRLLIEQEVEDHGWTTVAEISTDAALDRIGKDIAGELGDGYRLVFSFNDESAYIEALQE